METEPIRVPTKPRFNITEALRSLEVGESMLFPIGSNGPSIRTMATVHGIRLHMRMLDSGQIEVTRRPDKSDPPDQSNVIKI